MANTKTFKRIKSSGIQRHFLLLYLYYNKRMYNIGPVGILTVIPMFIIIFGCKQSAKKRQVKRIEEVLRNMQRAEINKEMIEELLEEDND